MWVLVGFNGVKRRSCHILSNDLTFEARETPMLFDAVYCVMEK